MTRYTRLMARLRAGETILIDGGTGTEVERRGVPQLENAWNGGGNLSHPDIVRAIHRDYISHGAEIVISNTFATSLNLLEDAGVPELFEDYNRIGITLAIEARREMERDQVLVAGGMSHWSFSGREPGLDAYRRGAAEQAKIMEAAGADLIMLEMMVDVAKMQALLDGVAETALPVWVGLSCAPDAEGRMCLQAGDADETGTVVAQEGAFLVDAVRALCGTSVPLISIMHTDVEHVDACLDVLDAEWAGLKGVYAHSGRFVDGGWVFEGTITPEAYGAASERWLARGVNLIGGCCGIRPDHIEVLGAKMTAAE